MKKVSYPTRTGKDAMDLVKFKDERIRRLFSGLFIVLLILLGIFAGEIAWLGAVCLISILSLWEFYELVSKKTHISKGIGIIASVVMFAVAYSGKIDSYGLPVFAISAFAILLIEVIRKQITGTCNVLWNLGATISGLSFIILPWIFLYILRGENYGMYVLLALFMCTWSCDVSAYVIGTRWGKKPLCDNVSPKKSWEGFWGGLAGSLLGSLFIPYIYGLAPTPYLLIGMICGIAGQLGDLGESVIKREAGVKDSGRLIPGHGGFLDRFDSILVSGTIIYLIFGVILG